MTSKLNKSVWEAGLVYGAIFGVVSIISSVIFYILGLTMSDFEKYFGMGLMLVLLVFFIYLYRQEYLGGYISYGRVIGIGVIVSLVAGVITAIYYYSMISWIDPNIQLIVDEKSTEAFVKQMAKRDIYPSQSEVDDMMETSKIFRSPGFISFGILFNSVLMGTIISLIAGIFIKKESKDPFAAIQEES